MWYSGLLQKPGRRRKIVLTREEAMQQCTHPLLLLYYQTLDEGWFTDTWNAVEKALGGNPQWKHYRSECYLYFTDRVQRFSILKDPAGLLLCYLKTLSLRRKKEISAHLPAGILLQTDESLLNIRRRNVYDS